MMSFIRWRAFLILFGVAKFCPYCVSIRLDCYREQKFIKINQDGLPTVNAIKVVTQSRVGFCTTACLDYDGCESVVFLSSKSENNCLLSNMISGGKADEASVSYIKLTRTATVCQTNPCEHGATCIDTCTAPYYYYCSCRPLYFKGQRCEENSKCEMTSPCQNRGTCSPSKNAPFYTCSCPYPFAGTNCEINTKCNHNQCYSGGHCYTQSTSPYYHCWCPWPFSGYSCQTNTRCYNNPCQHDGTCHTQGHSPYFWCDCKFGRWGDYCEKNPLNWG